MGRILVVVAAAGGGARFGGKVPKQYADLAGRPLLQCTLDRLDHLASAAVFVALAADDVDFERLIPRRRGVAPLRCGGVSRADTVRNAVGTLAAQCERDDWILVHDAARPCVPADALERLVRELEGEPVGGLLAIPLADTLKRGVAAEVAPRVLRTEDRAGLWQAQTPQMFRLRILIAALSLDAARSCTDEAQAVEVLAASGACGMPRLVQGSPANIKVTYPEDLALAAAILAGQEKS